MQHSHCNTREQCTLRPRIQLPALFAGKRLLLGLRAQRHSSRPTPRNATLNGRPLAGNLPASQQPSSSFRTLQLISKPPAAQYITFLGQHSAVHSGGVDRGYVAHMAGFVERITGCWAAAEWASAGLRSSTAAPSGHAAGPQPLLLGPTRSSKARLQPTQVEQRSASRLSAAITLRGRAVQEAVVGAHGFARTASITSDKSLVSAATRRKLAINAVQT